MTESTEAAIARLDQKSKGHGDALARHQDWLAALDKKDDEHRTLCPYNAVLAALPGNVKDLTGRVSVVERTQQRTGWLIGLLVVGLNAGVGAIVILLVKRLLHAG